MQRSPNTCRPHRVADGNIVQTTAWAKSIEDPTDDARRRAGERAVGRFVGCGVGDRSLALVGQFIACVVEVSFILPVSLYYAV